MFGIASRPEALVNSEVLRQQAALKQFVASAKFRQETYGIVWGDPRQSPHLQEVVQKFLLPFAVPDSVAVEIGAGGGRWSRELIGRAGKLILVDGVAEFEIAIRHQLDCTGVVFLVSPDGRLPAIADASVDFVFSFDTFVHFDAGLFDAYVDSIGRILKPGGHFVLHYARYFQACQFNPECFQYRKDDEVAQLLCRCRLSPVDELEFPVGYGSKLVVARKDLG